MPYPSLTRAPCSVDFKCSNSSASILSNAVTTGLRFSLSVDWGMLASPPLTLSIGGSIWDHPSSCALPKGDETAIALNSGPCWLSMFMGSGTLRVKDIERDDAFEVRRDVMGRKGNPQCSVFYSVVACLYLVRNKIYGRKRDIHLMCFELLVR